MFFLLRFPIKSIQQFFGSYVQFLGTEILNAAQSKSRDLSLTKTRRSTNNGVILVHNLNKRKYLRHIISTEMYRLNWIYFFGFVDIIIIVVAFCVVR